MDVILYSKNQGPLYAVLRRRCKSGLLVAFLNRFGNLGGYRKIIDRISLVGNDSLGIETVFYYLDCLAKSTPMFNKQFIDTYVPQLEEAVHN
jgi:hypothetical protein